MAVAHRSTKFKEIATKHTHNLMNETIVKHDACCFHPRASCAGCGVKTPDNWCPQCARDCCLDCLRKKWGKGCKGCHDDHIPPWIKESASTGFHVVATASHGFQKMEDLVDTDDMKKTTTEIVAQLPSTTDALGQTIYKVPLPRTPASWPDFDKKEDEDEEVWDRL